MAAITRKATTPEESMAELEAEIKTLREDMARLGEQMARTGRKSYGVARKAATEGAEQLREQGEQVFESLVESARDTEAALVDSIRRKPITSLALAAAAGFLFALVARR